MRQLAVVEGSQALAALRAGELSTYYPDGEATVLEAAMVAQRAFNLFESEAIRLAAKRTP